MAASSDGFPRPSMEVFRQSVQSICPMFLVPSLHESQLQALYSFICGEDVFVNLPTGYGKSLIFQMAPLVHAWMHENLSTCWKKDPIIVIISPLLALMQDQVKKLTSLNLRAAFVGAEQEPAVLQGIEEGKFTFVFISPESTLASERWRKVLESEIYRRNLIGIAVDEVHCVTEWGTSGNNKDRSAFRRWYSRLNEMRSFIGRVPFVALTATATNRTKLRIFELLEFESPKEISESPNKQNVRYSVQKLDTSLPLLENFRCLIKELMEKGKDSQRTIIYCQTIKQCSHLFRMFELALGDSLYHGKNDPRNRLVDMMHSGTPSSVKDNVLDQFADQTKCLRVLIATIAYGMGVNCKGVTRVIHFGPSKSIEAYMQESGRCGRSGEQSDALLLYNGLNLKAADSDMKEYVQSSTCRRKFLLKYFGTSHSRFPSGHICCDICAESCTCQGVHCNMDLHLPILLEEEEEDSRAICNEKLLELKEKLNALKKTLFKDSIAIKERNASIIGCPTTLLEFGTVQIQQVVDNAEHIFSVSDVLKHVDIWQRKHAVSVLKIFESTFNDVESPMSDSDSDDDAYFDGSNHEWIEMVNDQSFMDLIDQSEWDVDSILEEAPHDDMQEDAAYPEFLDSFIGDINFS